jgi:hypothetical protein
MAQMARQTRLAEEALVLPGPLRVDQLLAQFDERQTGTAPRRDMVAEEVNDVGDRDRLGGGAVKWVGTPFSSMNGW